MPPSPAHTARIRAEIFGHAGRLFRLRGYAGTTVDDVMLAAGLTRGAFYAHFKSKDDLFALVVASGQGLLWKLRSKDAEPLGVLDAYLAKDDLAANALDCTLAMLPCCRATWRALPCPPSSPMPTSCTPRSAKWHVVASASSMPTPRRRRSWRSARSVSHAPAATGGSATGCCAAHGRLRGLC
jgi:AcrR family transcriptional regulator